MARRIIIEPEWRDQPDYERLARALLRIAQALVVENEEGHDDGHDEAA